jgi:hypothetical protein
MTLNVYNLLAGALAEPDDEVFAIPGHLTTFLQCSLLNKKRHVFTLMALNVYYFWWGAPILST